MAFIRLESTNPQLSFLIRKNPASGMVVRQLREGILFGFYSADNERQFNGWFKDSETGVSYEIGKEFEFNDVTRYSAASFVINCIDELFRDLMLNDLEDDIEGYENSFLINCLRSRERILEIFKRSFKEFSLEYQPLAPGFFRVAVATKQPLRKLLAYTAILALINSIQNREHKIVDENQLIKYAKLIHHLDAPYFVRYQFKANLISRGSVFDKVREYLETDTIKFAYGHNFSQRMYFIERNIIGNTILDIGCGEGRYFRYAKKVERYFAIDSDESSRERARTRVEKKEIENVTVLESMAELPPREGPATVLLVEVIEHNTPEQALELVKSCIAPETRIIITTPNREFNANYDMEELAEDEGDAEESVVEGIGEENGPVFRHDEHLFEFTYEEFCDFITAATAGTDATVKFFKLGDSVDGISPQSAAIIEIP